MSGQEKIAVLGIVAALVGVFLREWHTRAIERKRSQPVMIAHELTRIHLDGDGTWSASTFLTNDGGGSAFNVRFGIKMRGVRYAYRLEGDDPLGGNRQSVVSAGERLPPTGSFLIRLTGWELFGAAARGQDGNLHTSAVYWCRYENSTRDMGDP